jgi:hypothetical protein
MIDDRIMITDPPEYDTRMEADDLPESLGDEFKLSVEDKAKIDRAARWGRSLIERARAGDQQALTDIQTRMHVTRWQVMR